MIHALPNLIHLSRRPLRGECGVAALAMMLLDYGIAASFDELIDTDGLSQPISFAELKRVASEQGLTLDGFGLSAAKLRELNRPAILHWKDNHLVYARSFIDAYAIIFDPAYSSPQGECPGYEYSDVEFSKLYTGVALIEPREKTKVLWRVKTNTPKETQR